MSSYSFASQDAEQPFINDACDSARLKHHHPALPLLLKKLATKTDFVLPQQPELLPQHPHRLTIKQKRSRHIMSVNILPKNARSSTTHDDPLYARFACIVFECAAEIGVRVRWGGNSPRFNNPHYWQLMTDHD